MHGKINYPSIRPEVIIAVFTVRKRAMIYGAYPLPWLSASPVNAAPPRNNIRRLPLARHGEEITALLILLNI